MCLCARALMHSHTCILMQVPVESDMKYAPQLELQVIEGCLL